MYIIYKRNIIKFIRVNQNLCTLNDCSLGTSTCLGQCMDPVWQLCCSGVLCAKVCYSLKTLRLKAFLPECVFTIPWLVHTIAYPCVYPTLGSH